MFGETQTETRARVASESRRFHRRGTQKMTPQSIEKLREILAYDPSLYLDEIQDILRVHNFPVSQSAIWQTIRKVLNWTLRIATRRARQRDEEQRQNYTDALFQFENPEMFIFLDETDRGRNESRRRRAWAPRGEDNSVNEFFVPEKDAACTFTMIAAADINGFVPEACELVMRKEGDSDSDDTRGTINADRFVLWYPSRNIFVM